MLPASVGVHDVNVSQTVVADALERDPLPVRRPGGRVIFPLIVCQTERFRTVGTHTPDIVMPAAIADKNDVAAVRGDVGLGVVGTIESELAPGRRRAPQP